MKNLKHTLVVLAIAITFTSCKNEQEKEAENNVEAYKNYVDSVSTVSQDKAIENWEAIDSRYSRLKMDADNSVILVSDKTKSKTDIDNSVIKYEEYKSNLMSEKDKMRTLMIYQSLLGPYYVADEMRFNWVNKNNILGVYENFVTTVQNNKDTYTREDWDKIKLAYEALDARKNTVEKEGLSATDNIKIAGLKLKFAPMYTANRIGEKSEENSDAKK